jgi:hypothetical protein
MWMLWCQSGRAGVLLTQLTVEALVPGSHSEKLFEGQSAGHKRIIKFPPVEAAQARVRVAKSTATPRLRTLAAYAPA